MINPPQAIDSKFKITAKATVELGLLEAFDGFTEIGEIERKARENGVKLTQKRGVGLTHGSAWDIEATIKRRRTVLELAVTDVQKPNLIAATLVSDRFTGFIKVQFKHKDQTLTQIRVDVSAQPKTLAARIVLHSLKLSRHRQRRRMERGLRALCRHLETGARQKG